jgi:hypothetical protein
MKTQELSQPTGMNRRSFLGHAGRSLAGALGAAHLPGLAFARPQGDDLDQYDFVMPRVRFQEGQVPGVMPGPDVWNVRPGGDANLLEELSRVVRCRIKPISGTQDWEPQYAQQGQLNAVVSLTEWEQLIHYPFLFMTGENYFRLSVLEKDNLKAYLQRGGFLLMDDCHLGPDSDFFYQSAHVILEELFSQGAVKHIPHDHEVFRNVFKLSASGLPMLRPSKARRRYGLPSVLGKRHGARGVYVEERLAVFLSCVDLHCGWCDRAGLEYDRPCYERAIQMGINIIVYAMTH